MTSSSKAPSISGLTADDIKTREALQSHGEFSWNYIRNVAAEHKRKLLGANLVAMAAVVAGVPIPLLMPLLVDEVLLEQPGSLVAFSQAIFPQSWQGPVFYIGFILLATIILRVLMLGLGVWQLRQFTEVAKDVTYRMRRYLVLRLQNVSMSAYETMGSASVSSKLVTDINAVDDFVGQSISKFIVSVLTLLGITIVLLWIHWQLALFIVLLNPVVIYFTVVLGKKVKELKKEENQAVELFQQALAETLDGIQQIRASNREQHYFLGIIKKAQQVKQHAAAFSWKSDAANRFSFGVFLFGFDVFRAVSMLMVVYSDLSVGLMMAVFGYLWFMMAPVQELLNIQYSYYGAKAALKRLNLLLTLPREPQYAHRQNPFAGEHTVALRIEDLSFSYSMLASDDEAMDTADSEDRRVLKCVNLTVAAGEKVALVGASGGGKTTLVQVLLGLYPAEQGEIFFNEVPVSDIGLDVVRANVATVLQNPALFNDTVRANLTLGKDIEDAKLWQALEIAQLADVVQNMSEGLDTVIGQRGVRLSGGQRQRLAIARMVLAQPKVVILDEATSALDTATEGQLHTALNKFLANRTTIIVAHRLSAVKQADRVYVFDDGEITEQGDHESLLQQNGLYRKLYGKQHH